jgi:hypothetical protein
MARHSPRGEVDNDAPPEEWPGETRFGGLVSLDDAAHRRWEDLIPRHVGLVSEIMMSIANC